METTTNKDLKTTQPQSAVDRNTELLCLIAQSLQRIERLLKRETPAQQTNTSERRIIHFNAGGQR